MNDALLVPAHANELKQMLANEKRLLPVGNRTKPPLSEHEPSTLISLRSLAGIIEYEPSEFTFTAYAGTPLAELRLALAEKRQYLPFDPMLVEAGATIGGTVAAGLSGPGRYRYGGIRDFLLGVRFMSSDGQLMTAGGKVVKNAAGFDIPKFFVGSMGRFGVLTELTFKVFPKPSATQTLRIVCDSRLQALARLSTSASSRWELDAIDYSFDEQALVLRLAGPPRACALIASEIRNTWGEDVSDLAASDAFWQSVGELSWSSSGQTAVKVPTTPQQLFDLSDSLALDEGIHLHGSAAGNVAWILLDTGEGLSALDRQLRALQMPGLVIRGPCDRPRLGTWKSWEVERTIQAAMDPPRKFPRWMHTAEHLPT